MCPDDDEPGDDLPPFDGQDALDSFAERDNKRQPKILRKLLALKPQDPRSLMSMGADRFSPATGQLMPYNTILPFTPQLERAGLVAVIIPQNLYEQFGDLMEGTEICRMTGVALSKLGVPLKQFTIGDAWHPEPATPPLAGTVLFMRKEAYEQMALQVLTAMADMNEGARFSGLNPVTYRQALLDDHSDASKVTKTLLQHGCLGASELAALERIAIDSNNFEFINQHLNHYRISRREGPPPGPPEA